MSIVHNKGINDMKRGWTRKSKWNNKVYNLWVGKLRVVYDEKFHEKEPTYINSSICLEWHWLSKFVEDIKKIDGYDEEKFLNGELELDKDIKSNGGNKEYCLENCKFIDKITNVKQASKTRNNDYLQGKNNHMYGKKHSEETIQKISNTKKGKYGGRNNPNYGKGKKIIQYDLEGNFIKIWNNANQAGKELNICVGNISKCCKNKYKSAGGYIWRYYKGDEE